MTSLPPFMVAPTDVMTPLTEMTTRNREAVTVVFTDIVGSTALKQRLGDEAGIALLEKHDVVIRSLLAEYAGARVLDMAGDSFALAFVETADAVVFSLRVHSALAKLSGECETSVEVRVGVHRGDLYIDENQVSLRKIGGIILDHCSRIMSLADGRQTLLSKTAFDAARRSLAESSLHGLASLEWLNHGSYQLKGLDEPTEICEVGEAGVAPLVAPTKVEKARRLSTPEGELVLGWRPAIGQQIPGTSWHLQKSLGEGGFGEVWLAQHAVLKERRVFKFCFRSDRVRSLKREVTLFRVLRERIGAHPHIVAVHDVYLEVPPYYVAMDYVEGNALPNWIASQGGFANVSVEKRIEIVAQIADGLAAAHQASVLHRDVKPSNILVGGSLEAPRAKLSDFGIGQILSIEALGNVTADGLTETLVGSSSGSGTQMYMAPELIRGDPSSPQSDLYSLGVVLFQVMVGDFVRPLAGDWADELTDPLLIEDLRQCLSNDPSKRFASPMRLAEQLRALPQRRAAVAAQRAEVVAAEKRAFRAGVIRTAMAALAVVALVVSLALFAWRQAERATLNARKETLARGRADQLLRKEWQRRVDVLLSENKPAMAMAYGAAAVRLNPKEPAGAERLLNALIQHPIATPVSAKLNLGRAQDIVPLPDGNSAFVITSDRVYWMDIASGKEVQTALPFGGRRGALTPDGRKLIIAGEIARVVDVGSFKELLKLENNGGGGRTGMACVAVRSQGDMAAVLDGSDELILWDPETGRRIREPFRTRSDFMNVIFSPDGKSIAASDTSGRVCVWDVLTGDLKWEDKFEKGVESIAWRPSGDRIAAGDAKGYHRIYNAETGRQVGDSIKAGTYISRAVFSPDGESVAFASKDSGTYIRSAETGTPIGEFPRDKYMVNDAEYSSDGRLFAMVTAEGIARIADTQSRQLALEPIQSDTPIVLTRFVPGRRIILVASADGGVQPWRVSAARSGVVTLHNGSQVRGVSFQSNAEKVLTAAVDGSIREWNLREPGPGRPVAKLSGSVEGVESVEGVMLVRGAGGTLWLLRRNPDGQWGQVENLPPASEVKFSPDGRRFVLRRVDGQIDVFSAADGKLVRGSIGSSATDAVLAKGSRDLVWIEDRSSIHRMNLETGELRPIPLAHRVPVLSVFSSQTGRCIVTMGGDGVSGVWDLDDESKPPLYLPQGGVGEISFSSDDRWMLAARKHSPPTLWELPEGRKCPESFGKPAELFLSEFLPGDARRMWTYDGNSYSLWDAPDRALSSNPWRLSGSFVVPSSDGQRIAVVSRLDSGPGNQVSIIETPRLREGAPSWLPDWAEMAAGVRLADDGSIVQIAPEERLTWIQRARELVSGDAYGQALGWWLEDPERRRVAPGSVVLASDVAVFAKRVIPSRDSAATPSQIDLTWFYNYSLDEEIPGQGEGNTLARLQPGLHRVDSTGTTFDVRGLIQLGSENTSLALCPRSIKGVAIHRKCRALMLAGAVKQLGRKIDNNGVQIGTQDGTEILRCKIHYADGESTEAVFRAEVEFGDWWSDRANPSVVVPILTTDNPMSVGLSEKVQIAEVRWDNPRPDQEIASIDLESTGVGAPFIVAITADLTGQAERTDGK